MGSGINQTDQRGVLGSDRRCMYSSVNGQCIAMVIDHSTPLKPSCWVPCLLLNCTHSHTEYCSSDVVQSPQPVERDALVDDIKNGGQPSQEVQHRDHISLGLWPYWCLHATTFKPAITEAGSNISRPTVGLIASNRSSSQEDSTQVFSWALTRRSDLSWLRSSSCPLNVHQNGTTYLISLIIVRSDWLYGWRVLSLLMISLSTFILWLRPVCFIKNVDLLLWHLSIYTSLRSTRPFIPPGS